MTAEKCTPETVSYKTENKEERKNLHMSFGRISTLYIISIAHTKMNLNGRKLHRGILPCPEYLLQKK